MDVFHTALYEHIFIYIEIGRELTWSKPWSAWSLLVVFTLLAFVVAWLPSCSGADTKSKKSVLDKSSARNDSLISMLAADDVISLSVRVNKGSMYFRILFSPYYGSSRSPFRFKSRQVVDLFILRALVFFVCFCFLHLSCFLWISLTMFCFACFYSSTQFYFVGNSADFLSRFLIDFIFIIGWNFLKKRRRRRFKKETLLVITIRNKISPDHPQPGHIIWKAKYTQFRSPKWTKNIAVSVSLIFSAIRAVF